jgi:hypothetical protein
MVGLVAQKVPSLAPITRSSPFLAALLVGLAALLVALLGLAALTAGRLVVLVVGTGRGAPPVPPVPAYLLRAELRVRPSLSMVTQSHGWVVIIQLKLKEQLTNVTNMA